MVLEAQQGQNPFNGSQASNPYTLSDDTDRKTHLN
jgi:hypothetical protein